MNSGSFDVYYNPTNTRFFEGKTNNSNEYIFLFNLNSSVDDVEVRVYNTGSSVMTIDSIELIQLNNTDITFSYSTSSWTSGNVNVTINSAKSGYTLEYSLNSTTWNTYTGPVTMTSNGPIYARLKDSNGIVTGMATGNVSNIDKTAPICTLSQANNNVEYEKRINVNCYDNESGVVLKKFAPGSRNAAYFASNGTTFTGNYFTAKTSQSGSMNHAPNMTYTVYSKNAAGLEKVTTIDIKNLYIWNTLTYKNNCLAIR